MKKFFNFLRNLTIVALTVAAIGSTQTVGQATWHNNSLETPGQTVQRKNEVTVFSKAKGKHKPLKADKDIRGKSRWPKATATVYINTKDDFEMYSAAIDAIDAWNQTGAFTFKEIKSKKKANIVIGLMDDDDTEAAGETMLKYQPRKRRITKAKIYLNVYYLENIWYGYSYERVVNTAEHELGHAMGLNHNKGVSVMYPAGSYYDIKKRDINAVKKLYNEK
ncbi:matrixin family metalloprotease [Lactobacillus sp. ESL0791]|uniref:matrixin family metalloprotease n=1 Tax=Lactobacillus sp. ESL0791 TaxID=2983234 RepID=UPI0023F8030D|nr:matrixin family metalloprotease [Lactobacillus sp. ESL0791]MDF7639526.1 matrixin family metalloprotease [Lactobacillus sp. ESL0791]